MLTCSRCTKEFTLGSKGWYARVEGLGPGARSDTPLRRTLLCPDDFKAIPASQRMGWHEFTAQTVGPTREKRPGRLGEEP
jgi:hypothetical protein